MNSVNQPLQNEVKAIAALCYRNNFFLPAKIIMLYSFEAKTPSHRFLKFKCLRINLIKLIASGIGIFL